MKFKIFFMKWMLNIYPPYLGTGISDKFIAPDFKRILVQLKMHWYNRNYVKTHFGGSLYAMTDPFLMLMLIQILGKNYVVWDKSAQIEFIKPGLGTVSAGFIITEREVEYIIKQTAGGKKYFHDFMIEILDENGEPAAKVEKRLYIREKRKAV